MTGGETRWFDSGASRCAATLYLPTGADTAVPCVVLGHGLSAVQDQMLGVYATAFADAGFAALTFDYRGFGRSEGEPRQVADIDAQLDDWRNAIAFARELPRVDPERVAVWGTSFSGGHVQCLGAEDHRLGAVIAQAAHTDQKTGRPGEVGLGDVLRMIPPAIADEFAMRTGRPPRYVAVTGPRGTARYLTQTGVPEEFAAITPPDSTWRNQLAARTWRRIAAHRPGLRAGDIASPVLYCIARDDLITPPEPMRIAAQLAPRGESKEYPCGHFEVYVDPWRSRFIEDQVEFLRRHLQPDTSIMGDKQ